MMKLYTTHCPKCKVIETKLFSKGIPFNTVEDNNLIMEAASKSGFNSAPLLELEDGRILDFVSANKYINTL